MVFKFEIGHGKRTAHLEAESESIMGKKLGEKISGDEISPNLSGYELEITGASDKAGFPSAKKVEGPGLKRLMLTKGFALRKLKKKKKTATRKKIKKGLRKRRTVRGNTISGDTVQINLKVLKEGSKKFDEIFPVKQKQAAAPAPAAA
jgi:small subunit ribosomal protein S6e